MRRPEVIVGIDVGVGGAVAVLPAKFKMSFQFSDSRQRARDLLADHLGEPQRRGGQDAFVEDMPTVPRTSQKKTNKREIDAANLAKLIRGIRQTYLVRMIFVELATPRPRDGSMQGFAFGTSYGKILGVLGTLEVPYEIVSPVTWKRRAKLLKTDKEVSRKKAIELFPRLSNRLTRKKDHGRAEALLIAYYGGGDVSFQ
jgi:crossover junction endodeoxyribonuclease RuvC